MWEPHLPAVEQHKARSLPRFLDRSQKRYLDCYEAHGKSDEELVISYQSLSEEWKAYGGRFLGLTGLDGFFSTS